MMSAVQPVSPLGLGLSLVMIVATIGIMRWVGLTMTRDLVVGTLRTFGQLILIGFLLEYILAADQWFWVVGLLMIMVVIAAHTARQRMKGEERKGLFGDMGFAILLGAGLVIAWVNKVVLNVHPWYHPQYLIPLAGMVIGNSMNSASLAIDRFHSEMTQRRAEIETLLALGATFETSAQASVKAAISAAMIPNINAMMIVGVVSFPGTMTGQILAGQSPLTAVNYQIIVMLMLTCAAAITAVSIIKLTLRRYALGSGAIPSEKIR